MRFSADGTDDVLKLAEPGVDRAVVTKWSVHGCVDVESQVVELGVARNRSSVRNSVWSRVQEWRKRVTRNGSDMGLVWSYFGTRSKSFWVVSGLGLQEQW